MKLDRLIKFSSLFLKLAIGHVQLSLSNYSKNLLAALLHMSSSSTERLGGTRLSDLLQEIKDTGVNNPNILEAIVNKDEDQLFSLLRLEGDIPNVLKMKAIDYCSAVYSEEDARRNYEEILSATQENMGKIVNIVNDAINRIEGYGGTKWKIIPEVPETYPKFEKTYSEPCDCADVVSTTNPSIYFSLIKEDGSEKFIVEDIIEDDMDVDAKDGWQKDYYSLINEIRKPGSTSRGRNVTLYTARPVNDREFYTSTATLPNGIYLTSSLDSAAGIALDMGSGKARDVWMFRINSKYLLQTLEGYEKQYRIVAGPEGAPIVAKELMYSED